MTNAVAYGPILRNSVNSGSLGFDGVAPTRTDRKLPNHYDGNQEGQTDEPITAVNTQ
jgi:hypothetical protein